MSAFDSVSNPEYILMNKNVEIASFAINYVIDSTNVVKQFTKLPYWISELDTFIKNRRALKHRENIAQLLQQSRCNTLRGFIDITHALSFIHY